MENTLIPFFFLILSTAALRKWLEISLEIFCGDFGFSRVKTFV